MAPHLAVQSSGAARRAYALLFHGNLRHQGNPHKDIREPSFSFRVISGACELVYMIPLAAASGANETFAKRPENQSS